MAFSAFRASAGCVSITRPPTPAWIAMTPMLWAIMSCSSREIRSRSAATARAAACSRACSRSISACARRARTEVPAIRATAMASSTVAVTRSIAAVGEKASRERICTASVATATGTETRRGRVAAM